MDEVIETTLHIEELRDLICEYCNIEDILKLHIILELDLPVKYTKNILNKYLNLQSNYINEIQRIESLTSQSIRK